MVLRSVAKHDMLLFLPSSKLNIVIVAVMTTDLCLLTLHRDERWVQHILTVLSTRSSRRSSRNTLMVSTILTLTPYPNDNPDVTGL